MTLASIFVASLVSVVISSKLVVFSSPSSTDNKFPSPYPNLNPKKLIVAKKVTKNSINLSPFALPKTSLPFTKKRSIVYALPMSQNTVSNEWIQKIMINPNAIQNGGEVYNLPANFLDIYNKEKDIQTQINSINVLKDYISKNGLANLTPWAIDTITKASTARTGILNGLQEMQNAPIQEKSVDNTVTNTSSDEKAESFIKNGSGSGGTKINVADLNSYFEHANQLKSSN